MFSISFPISLRCCRNLQRPAVFLVAFVFLYILEASTIQAQNNKILCLHGGGGSATSFQNIASDLENALPDFEFVYINGGYPIGNKDSYLWIEDPPGGKEEPTTDPAWADVSVQALDAVVEAQGPFYGIMGYSQGAAFVPVYLSRVPVGTFQIALTFGGYLTTTHLGLLDVVNNQSPFGGLPHLVWMGTEDFVISNGMTQEMATKFTDPTIVVSVGGGHVVPGTKDSTFDQVTAFVLEHEPEPTVSPVPSLSSVPTQVPTTSHAPTVSSSPTLAPTLCMSDRNVFLWIFWIVGAFLKPFGFYE